MFEYGYITDGEVVRCINYLLCHYENDKNEHILDFKNSSIEKRRVAPKLKGYDKLAVWDGFFCSNEKLARIMSAKRITDIDYLLFRSWDYYDLDMAKCEDKCDLTGYDDDAIKKTNPCPSPRKKTKGELHMLTAEQIKKTREKINVSKDADKTMKRVKKDFSSASNADKTKIVELSGQVRASFYRVYRTGSINARLVLAMSQVLKVSPFYYTGEEDRKARLQDIYLYLFLQNNGYTNILAELGITEEIKPEQNSGKAPVDAGEVIPPPEAVNAGQQDQTHDTAHDDLPQEPVLPDAVRYPEALNRQANEANHTQLSLPDSPDMESAIAELSVDDAIMLLRSLYIRGKASEQAGELAKLVKRCLLA